MIGQSTQLDCDAVLFDLDGVLIDSTECVERHWTSWANQHGLDAVSILRIAHGVRNVETMRLVAPHLDVEKEAALFAAGEVADTAGVVAVEGASQIIESLQGAHWAVVTSCSTALAHARLREAQLPVPIGSGAGVEHFGDRRMIHARQSLPLGSEALQQVKKNPRNASNARVDPRLTFHTKQIKWAMQLLLTR